MELAISVAVGYFIGDWLDERFDTRPWLGLVFIMLGIAAGFRNLLRAARKAMREDAEADARADEPPSDGTG